MTTKQHKIQIPFDGFYESASMGILMDEIEQEENYTGETIFEYIDWGRLRQEYASLYVRAFNNWLEGETGFTLDASFHSVRSPSFYNFETDTITATIATETLDLLFNATPVRAFEAELKERFEPRSGFIPFYPQEARLWRDKPLYDWDHVELGTLLASFMRHYELELDIYSVMEDDRCNGVIHNLIWDTKMETPKHG